MLTTRAPSSHSSCRGRDFPQGLRCLPGPLESVGDSGYMCVQHDAQHHALGQSHGQCLSRASHLVVPPAVVFFCCGLSSVFQAMRENWHLTSLPWGCPHVDASSPQGAEYVVRRRRSIVIAAWTGMGCVNHRESPGGTHLRPQEYQQATVWA